MPEQPPRTIQVELQDFHPNTMYLREQLASIDTGEGETLSFELPIPPGCLLFVHQPSGRRVRIDFGPLANTVLATIREELAKCPV